MKIKISTDSTADIPAEICKELDIEVLPLTVISGENEWLDGKTITPDEFYEVLDNSSKLPTSAAIPPILYTELFEKAWKEGYSDLIHTSINSKGSSTYQNGVLAREMFYEAHPEALESFKIHLIDSLTYSMGYGMAVIKAARMAIEGKNADEIISEIKDCTAHSRAMFVPLDLKCVKKSGRVSPAAAFVGDALGLKPIIVFEDGEAKIISKARGEKKAMAEIIEICNKEKKPGSPFAIVVGKNKAAAETFISEVKNNISDPATLVYKVGCIIAINTGPNMIGLIYRT